MTKTKINISASIQARMGSTRLPGKVLKKINGKPMLLWQVERLRECNSLKDIIIATTTNREDDKIVQLCIENSISYFRGSENDVIDRVSSLIEEYKIDIHVECVGDSPLIDPLIVEEYIEIFCNEDSDYDYLSNCINTSYPPGLDVIIYNATTLIDLNKFLEKNDPLREHVGYNITRFPQKYKIKSITAPKKYYYPDFYLEVDSKEDFILIEKIFKYFISKEKPKFYLKDILKLLTEYPDIKNINNKTPRKWKLLRGEKN